MKNNNKNLTSLRSFKMKQFSNSRNIKKTNGSIVKTVKSGSKLCDSLIDYSRKDFSNQDFSKEQDKDKFSCTILENADLSTANLTSANLTDVKLREANLTRANLTRANLTRANLRAANLTNANLTDAILERTNLTGAILQSTGAIVEGVKLEANLTRANLKGANLTGANLTGANLIKANLTGATIKGTNLTNANLTGATLSDATLTDANLKGATFTDVILKGKVNFAGATIKKVIGFNSIKVEGELTITLGGKGGDNFVDIQNITSIKLVGGVIVNAIYINGTKYGGNGIEDKGEIILEVDEYINEVTISTGHVYKGFKGYRAVNYLEFITSKGKNISCGNKNNDNIITLKNIKVTKIGGNCRDFLNSIRITFIKI